MKQFKIYILFFLALFEVVSTSSCRKFIEVATPPDQIFTADVFKDESTATSAMIGLYSEMARTNLNFANGALTLYPALSADELYRTSSSASVDVFTTNNIPSSNSILRNNFWTAPYSYIYHANAMLEGLETANFSDSVKKQLQGEALFTRAFCYFYLVNLFGDVPLVLSTDYRINANLPRTSAAVVYNQMIQDLQTAKSRLPVSFSIARLRPNRYAAMTLLARIYLYTRQWQQADTEASIVVASGMYSLANITASLATSNEPIWKLTRETQNSSEGATFIPSSATVRPTYALTDTLLKGFETGDQRKINWLKSNIVSGTTYVYPYKYKVASSTAVTENIMMIRYSEVWLIRAEARTELNNLPAALGDLNTIRSRAGLPSLSGLDQAQLREAIVRENRAEFFCEWETLGESASFTQCSEAGNLATYGRALSHSVTGDRNQPFPNPKSWILT
jgi:hypothetical protein